MLEGGYSGHWKPPSSLQNEIKSKLALPTPGFLPGLPPCHRSLPCKCFSWFLPDQQSPKLFLIATNPNRREQMFNLLTEEWGLKVTHPTSVLSLTLYFWVENHVQNCPAEGGGGGLSPSSKQVCGHQTKVVIVETALFSSLALQRANKEVTGAGALAGKEDDCAREVLRSTRSVFADQEVHWESRAEHRSAYDWCTLETLLSPVLEGHQSPPVSWGMNTTPTFRTEVNALCSPLPRTAGPCTSHNVLPERRWNTVIQFDRIINPTQ